MIVNNEKKYIYIHTHAYHIYPHTHSSHSHTYIHTIAGMIIQWEKLGSTPNTARTSVNL